MLRINTSKVSAKTYYTQNISRNDSYYVNRFELPGQWGGRGAAMLGLSGEVEHDAFAALCDNAHPHTGERLTVRIKEGRRIGYDLTFDAPKSVSLLNAFSSDKQILEAYQMALDETMSEIEANAEARVRRQGKDENRITGNLTFAKFTHFTARPMGGIPDPQLHTHVFVLNATYDPEEKRWKAVQMGQIKTDAPYYQAIFHSKLANNLREIGYKIRPTKHAFEIDGISDKVIAEFSRRKNQIEKQAQLKGITHPKIKARLGALTREAKRHDLPPEQLNELWKLRLAQFSKEQQKILLNSEQLISQPMPQFLPADYQNAISQAREHCFYHNSIVTEKEFIGTALRFGIGQTDFETIRKKISEDKMLLRGHTDGLPTITTPEIRKQEKELVNWVRDGLNTCLPIKKGYICSDFLDDEQKQALKHVLESPDRVTGVHGKAGTGKTTLMREAISAIEHTGKYVAVLAPTADASRRTLRKSGFEHAETVQKFLTDSTLQQQAQGGVVWVDEAGLLSIPDMKRITDMADSLDARLVLTGDTKQHSSVERGDALRVLKEHECIKMAELETNRRQQNDEYRKAVNDLSEGKVLEGMKKLDKLGSIIEIKNEQERHGFLAEKYVESLNANRSALVVSPTHAEGRKVTSVIREKLKAQKKIKKAKSLSVLQKVDMTFAEKTKFVELSPWLGVANGEISSEHPSRRAFNHSEHRRTGLVCAQT